MIILEKIKRTKTIYKMQRPEKMAKNTFAHYRVCTVLHWLGHLGQFVS